MPPMQFGLSAFERARGDLPALPVINMFVEKAATEETGIALQSRSALHEAGFSMGDGPVQALFLGDGALAASLFGVSGTALYSGSDLLGPVDGPGPFSIAAYETRLFTAGGGRLWTFAGVTLEPIAFPDAASVSKVLIAASRVVALRADTGRFYWTEPLDTVIDPLAFATAENQPDRLRDALFIDAVLVLFGAETVEFWPAATDPDLPFQPLPGRVFEKGIKATGCASEFGSTFAWVTNVNQICVSEPDNIISEPGLEALIEKSANVRLQRYFIEGTEFLWLSIDQGDWAYSARSRLWSQLETYDEDTFLPSSAFRTIFGSRTDGRVLLWGDDFTETGSVLERRFRAGIPIDGGAMAIDNISLRVNVGATPFLTGDYADPVVEMKLSRDGGKTWGAWRARALGRQGEYRQHVIWRSCGMASRPGLLVEFRVTDPVPFRVSDVRFNEPYGGR